jgi:hypothetical protein
VTIPDSDWTLCKRYKVTLEKRSKDLKDCASQGISVRQKRDQCVGELSGRITDGKVCARSLGEYKLKAELLEVERSERKSGMFWASVGAGLLSVGALALEVFGGESPEVSKLVTLCSATVFSAALIIWTF